MRRCRCGHEKGGHDVGMLDPEVDPVPEPDSVLLTESLVAWEVLVDRDVSEVPAMFQHKKA